MRKQQIAIIALALWLTLIGIFMLFTQNVDFEIFFVFGSIGFFAIIEFIEPHFVRYGNLRYKRYIIAAWILIFGSIVVHKILEILTR